MNHIPPFFFNDKWLARRKHHHICLLACAADRHSHEPVRSSQVSTLIHCLALDPFRRFYSSCPFLGSLLHLGMRICPGICSVTLQSQSQREIKTRGSKAVLLPLQAHLFQEAFCQLAEQTSPISASHPSSEGEISTRPFGMFQYNSRNASSVNFHFLDSLFAGQLQHC